MTAANEEATESTPTAAAPAIDPPPPTSVGEEVAATTPQEALVRLCGAILAVLVAYACVLAEAVIVPILIAILLGLMFAPLVRGLERWRVPRPLGALVAVTIAIATLAGAFFALAAPARTWIARMPRALEHLHSTLRDLRRPLQAASEATRELGKLAHIGGSEPMQVVDSSSGLLAQLASAAPTLLAGALVVLFLTFLFLLHGDALLRKFVALAPHLRAKRDLVQATRQAQHELSLYMITITLINLALGLATAGALKLLHVPDPLLWGGLAALMNYAPFIGPLLTACVLAVAGLAEFAAPLDALAAPAAFLGLHLVEGQLITPHLVGRRLALDPVMVFLALVVLGWVWGVAGLLLAVPLMSCAKIIAERSEHGGVVTTLLSH
jgi:predicted PurR-regulated permease PerM